MSSVIELKDERARMVKESRAARERYLNGLVDSVVLLAVEISRVRGSAPIEPDDLKRAPHVVRVNLQNANQEASEHLDAERAIQVIDQELNEHYSAQSYNLANLESVLDGYGFPNDVDVNAIMSTLRDDCMVGLEDEGVYHEVERRAAEWAQARR